MLLAQFLDTSSAVLFRLVFSAFLLEQPQQPETMEWGDFFADGPGDFLVKAGVFLLVQALVYLILSKSSNVFSPARMGSFRLRTVRSASLRRILAALGDQPAGSEPSPQGSSTPLRRESSTSDGKEDAARW